jgi:hypothetical protein
MVFPVNGVGLKEANRVRIRTALPTMVVSIKLDGMPISQPWKTNIGMINGSES